MDDDLEAGRIEKVEVRVSDKAGYGEDRIRLAVESSHLLKEKS